MRLCGYMTWAILQPMDSRFTQLCGYMITWPKKLQKLHNTATRFYAVWFSRLCSSCRYCSCSFRLPMQCGFAFHFESQVTLNRSAVFRFILNPKLRKTAVQFCVSFWIPNYVKLQCGFAFYFESQVTLNRSAVLRFILNPKLRKTAVQFFVSFWTPNYVKPQCGFAFHFESQITLNRSAVLHGKCIFSKTVSGLPEWFRPKSPSPMQARDTRPWSNSKEAPPASCTHKSFLQSFNVFEKLLI